MIACPFCLSVPRSLVEGRFKNGHLACACGSLYRLEGGRWSLSRLLDGLYTRTEFVLRDEGRTRPRLARYCGDGGFVLLAGDSEGSVRRFVEDERLRRLGLEILGS